MFSNPEGLLESLKSCRRVEGFTHNFYNYPARFSPQLAREVISEFSEEGDWVIDPFMGGGTTVVEALASGRKALGIDINPLSHFIADVKTRPLSERDQEQILLWAEQCCSQPLLVNPSCMNDQRLKNLPNEVLGPMLQAVSSVDRLKFRRQRRFARCALLKLGQWSMDCRKEAASAADIQRRFSKQVAQMLTGLEELSEAARERGTAKNKMTGCRILCLGPSEDVMKSTSPAGCHPRPRLVLTSPPYPGVHVLYHRWQVKGRRETPAPYWLADLRDGHRASYYTLGSRTPFGLRNYFTRIKEIYGVLREYIHPNAIVVQLIAFSDPSTQVPAFLDAMTAAGYEELTPLASQSAVRPSRRVPNRKWYTQSAENAHCSNEILLFHRPHG
jgi:hypothetical protein